jgi:glycine/D-amino acid oxidase-like deaminating enzyme/nitrite reductase/ring-hydroxylating ferredoxin subunit
MTSPSTVSLWNATAHAAPPRPMRPDDHGDVDVLVVGAGIVGLTAALQLAREGRSVLVLDVHGVGRGVTGSTTGKVTAAHGLRYAQLQRTLGEERTRLYARANQDAVGWVRDLVTEHGIDCDWQDRPAYTYTSDPAQARKLRAEAQATIAAGLPAHEVHGLPAPTPMAAGVRVDGGGELNGRNYCLALATLAEEAGATIAEGVRVTAVREGTPCRVRTEEHGELRAEHVVVATHFPIFDRGLYFARLQPQRSYAIAARLDRDLPLGSFLDVAKPSRSVRTATGPDGGQVVVVGGEGHDTGKVTETGERYARLEAWAAEQLGAGEVTHRWSAQDPMTPDMAPFVGALRPGSTRLWTATGFGKWGLSGGTAAGLALAGSVQGRPDEYAALWSPQRSGQGKPRPLAKIALWNAETGVLLAGDRLRPAGRGGLSALGPGDGRIVRHGGRRTAAFRDEAGVVHAHSPVCTHLGCEVHFNDAEQSWDCPCHGSRFDARDGSVLEGPAVKPLAPRDAG